LGSRTPATSDLPALPLTRAVIEEAMRLYPPIYAFDRRAEEPDRVGGYDIPAGAFISLCPFVTHRMPEFWEAPERFMPERFLPGAANAPRKFSYLPFSAGPRQCIGAGFAMTEMVLVLARVLQRYRLRLPPTTVVEPSAGITLRPRHGLPMLATPIRL
jgi:cytochrome P450